VGASGGVGFNNHHKFSLTGTFISNSYNNHNNNKCSGRWERETPKSPGRVSGGGNDEPSSGEQKKDKLSRQHSY
jgi:hypothetical protein